MAAPGRSSLQVGIAANHEGPPGDVLISIFLRGGADGLNLVPPYREPAYYAARPSLAIAPPDDQKADAGDRAWDLDGFFGLHPRLRPLLLLYQKKQLAIVHAVGSDDQTRSHFEAQDLMERGCGAQRTLGSGWLARHLRTRPGRHRPLAAVAIGDRLPESLRGSPGASAVRRVDEFAIPLGNRERSAFEAGLQRLYRDAGGQLGRAGLQVLQTLGTVQRLRRRADQAEGGGTYPDGPFGDRLRQVARLIKAQVGLEVACVDLGGWDTHFVQGASGGLFGGLAGQFASGLAAFWQDIGPFHDRVTVVAMTEFGRRLYENVSFGTDHGRASTLFVLGGGIRGGQVVADWPGLQRDQLEGPGDLRVTIDYRDILAEIVSKRLGNPRLADVFPGYAARQRGIVR